MSESSKSFNFDEFDTHIQEALDSNEIVMDTVIGAMRASDGEAERVQRPGEIGAVMILGYQAQ